MKISITYRRLSALAVLALPLLGGCTVNPATGDRDFTAFMSPEDELRVGAEEHPKILKELGGAYADRQLSAYVARIGRQLARSSEMPDLAFRFTVLNDDRVNAFALPGGYVYVTRGLLALAENEAEVAGVLAHEIGHVTARHTAQRYSTTMATSIGLNVLGVLGSIAGVPSGVGQAVSLGAQAALQGYSRSQELEADTLGVRYLARAGYDPDGMTGFFRKLAAHSELEAQQKGAGGVKYNFMSTHPKTEARIVQAIELAKITRVADPIVRRDAYLDKIDGLVFGDDPKQGVRKGREFLHPELRIAFIVPPGFVLLNSPRQVTAVGPKGSRFVFDLAKPGDAAAARTAGRYIAKAWAANLTLDKVENIEINGMAAATGAARLNVGAEDRDLRLVAIQGEPDKIYRLAFLTPPSETRNLNDELRRTTYSFRRLSDAEAAAIQPLRIRLTEVRQGDTAASLAARLPFERFSREWFRVLNGLAPGDALRPGQRVKLVGP